jgi:hypothetical protein
MTAIIYCMFAAGFIEAGWTFWQSIWWPYYLAKKIGAQAQVTIRVGKSKGGGE